MIEKPCGVISARYTMKADVLRQYGNPDPGGGGYWETYIDPDSNEVVRKWFAGTPDDPDTPLVDETAGRDTIRCMARNVKSDGMRVNATTDDWGELVGESDYVNIWFAASSGITVSKRDRITNIRDGVSGQVFWMEEEFDTPVPTTFDVIGIEPKFDAFGRVIEWKATLERSEVQQNG